MTAAAQNCGAATGNIILSVVLWLFLCSANLFPYTASLSSSGKDGRPRLLGANTFSHRSAASEGILIEDTNDKGLGAFTAILILAGAWVGEYEGEILTRKEVEARYWETRKLNAKDRRWSKSRKKRNMGMSGDYLFDMGDDLFIDGEDADCSSWSRFMNHAAEGTTECNVETRCTRQIWDGEKYVQPRLWFVAKRDIQNGEELSYDYGDEYWD